MEPESPVGEITRYLIDIGKGNRQAIGQLAPLVYDHLRGLARAYFRRERPDHTLQPTALVNEAYLKLVDQSRVPVHGRSQFFALSAQAMRRILVDYARQKRRGKRGGGHARITLDEAVALSPQKDEDVLALDEALSELAAAYPRQAQGVELRFFGGLQLEEAAEVLGVSRRTVAGDWRLAKAWLRRALTEGEGNP